MASVDLSTLVVEWNCDFCGLECRGPSGLKAGPQDDNEYGVAAR